MKSKCVALLLAAVSMLLFASCNKTTVPDPILDFCVFDGEEMVAAVDKDYNTFAFYDFDEEYGQQSNTHKYPVTYGYKVTELNTYRGVRLGDTLEEVANKYEGMVMYYVLDGSEKDNSSDVGQNITLQEYLAGLNGDTPDYIDIGYFILQIGDAYYSTDDVAAQDFAEKTQVARNNKSGIIYDSYGVRFVLENGIVSHISMSVDYGNPSASKDKQGYLYE